MAAMVPLASVQDQQLVSQVATIEAQMSHTRPATRPSPFSRLLVSGFILVIALGGVVVNFFLIGEAMAEMVGDARIGSFSLAHVHALVVIVVQLSMGVFLLDSLRITRLFPVIGSLLKVQRTRITVISLAILIMLAASEVGLVYLAEVMQQRDDVTRSSLAEWPSLLGKLGLGLILPFALAFVAIPLNSFVNAACALLGRPPSNGGTTDERPDPVARR